MAGYVLGPQGGSVWGALHVLGGLFVRRLAQETPGTGLLAPLSLYVLESGELFCSPLTTHSPAKVAKVQRAIFAYKMKK